MNAFQFPSAQPWVEHLGWTLIHFLWQGALRAAIYAVAQRRLRPSHSAQIRYFLASAALAASIYHYGTYTIQETKRYLAERGVPVRLAAS